jgi:hypothetical protein
MPFVKEVLWMDCSIYAFLKTGLPGACALLRRTACKAVDKINFLPCLKSLRAGFKYVSESLAAKRTCRMRREIEITL